MWEDIMADNGPKMRRMAVPGGWLYAEYYNTQVYPVFVPQPAELGDKVKPVKPYDFGGYYEEGYAAGFKDAAETSNGTVASQGDKVKPSDLASWLTRATDLLAESLSKWEDEEDSVKEEHAGHIESLNQFFDDWQARKVER